MRAAFVLPVEHSSFYITNIPALHKLCLLQDNSGLKMDARTTKNTSKQELTLAEYECLASMPTGYVKTPIENLFEAIKSKGFLSKAEGGTSHWITEMDQKYHVLRRSYCKHTPCYNLSLLENELIPSETIQLVMANITVGGDVCFGAEDYGTYLIGEAFSIPVITILLEPG